MATLPLAVGDYTVAKLLMVNMLPEAQAARDRRLSDRPRDRSRFARHTE